MLRFVSRTLGLWLIAAALIVAVVDGAKSIAASALVLTPLSEIWARLGSFGRSAAVAEAPPEAVGSWPVGAFQGFLLSAPTVTVLAAAGVLLLFAGRRRRSQYLGRGYAA